MGNGFRGQRDQEAPQEDAQAQEEEAAQARPPQAEALARSSHQVATRPPCGFAPRVLAMISSSGTRGHPLLLCERVRSRSPLAPGFSKSARVEFRAIIADVNTSGPRRFGSVLRGGIDELPAAWCFMILFFLRFSLDAAKKTLLASFATVALLPRIDATRGHIAFKSPVPGSDRGQEPPIGGCPKNGSS